MKEKCESCRYIRRLKHNFTVGKGFEESNCCVVNLEIDGSDGWAQEVNKDDVCEMYGRRIHDS